MQSMHSHVAIRRQWGGPARCVPLLFVMLHAGCLRACRGRLGGGGWYAGRKAWQLGKAKLFSMHALKGAEPLCASLLSRKIFVRRPPPPRNFIYSVWSLTLRLAKLFDKPLSLDVCTKATREHRIPPPQTPPTGLLLAHSP